MSDDTSNIVDFLAYLDAVRAGRPLPDTFDVSRGRQLARLAMAIVRHAGVPNEYTQDPDGIFVRHVYFGDVAIAYSRFDLIRDQYGEPGDPPEMLFVQSRGLIATKLLDARWNGKCAARSVDDAEIFALVDGGWQDLFIQACRERLEMPGTDSGIA